MKKKDAEVDNGTLVDQDGITWMLYPCSDSPNQSDNRYKTFDSWIYQFFIPMLKKSWDHVQDVKDFIICERMVHYCEQGDYLG